MTIRARRPLLVAILATYLALAIGYGIATPLFETPDEHLHFFTAEFIARERRLPTTADPGLMAQEAAQPPLYYVLSAILISPIDLSDAGQQLWPNPRTDTSASAGQLWANPQADPADPRGESRARPPINVNMFIHGPAEDWPWRGYALAAHVLRLFSALIGLGTLLFVYAAGRVVWPHDDLRPLLATALVAFLPQFAFLHGGVNNDTLITLFGAAAMWQLLRLRYSAGPATSGRLLLLGLTIGLAMLSKAAGILLLVYCLGVLVVLGWARRERLAAAVVRPAGLVLLPALAVGGWLLWRNWTLYGDPTAANQFIAIAGGRPYTLIQVWHDMDRVWTSFFALFGWMIIEAPPWVYWVWNGIVVAALVGAAAAVWRARSTDANAPTDSRLALPGRGALVRLGLHPGTILLGWFLAVAAGWLQFMLRTPADQGRLFYPALVPLALGAAYGLGRWPRPSTQALVAGLALATSAFCLLVTVPQAYARPPVVAALPPDVSPLDISFPEGLDLLGATLETDEALPDDWVWATLYWRLRPDYRGEPPLVRLGLFGRDFRQVGQTVAYPGRGNYPTFLWTPGEIVADRLAVRLQPWAELPVQGRLEVRLDEDANGIPLGTLKLAPDDWPPATTPPAAAFGETVDLGAAALSATTARPGDTIEVRLQWQARAPLPAVVHTFVHLGDPTQQPLAQTDGPVMGGQYPAGLWARGEVFSETVRLSLPADLLPGDYPINVGLYDFGTGVRLPVAVGGSRQPTDTYMAGRLTVE